jgi:hypothetical protein
MKRTCAWCGRELNQAGRCEKQPLTRWTSFRLLPNKPYRYSQKSQRRLARGP